MENGIVLLFVGAGIVAFIWWIVYLAGEHIYTYEKWIDGVWCSTKKAHRICGRVGNAVKNCDIDGLHWHCWIESLWRVNERQQYGYDGIRQANISYKPDLKFFILKIDELASPEIKLVSVSDAKEFIQKYAGKEADALISDWCTQ